MLREAFRVLKPAAASRCPMSSSGAMLRPKSVANMELWVGCIAGALQDTAYEEKLRHAGFQDVTLEPWRIYNSDDARSFLAGAGLDVNALARDVDGAIVNAFIRARKPMASKCCGPECCQ